LECQLHCQVDRLTACLTGACRCRPVDIYPGCRVYSLRVVQHIRAIASPLAWEGQMRVGKGNGYNYARRLWFVSFTLALQYGIKFAMRISTKKVFCVENFSFTLFYFKLAFQLMLVYLTVTSIKSKVVFSPASVCLGVCLSVRQLDDPKSSQVIFIIFHQTMYRIFEYCYGENRLNFRFDPAQNGRMAAILVSGISCTAF